MKSVAGARSANGKFHSFASRQVRGVTLIELMVVVSILAVLLGLAVPNMRTFYINNRLGGAVNSVIAALSLARSEAVRRGQPVTIVSVAGGQNWTNGWTVCLDGGASTGGNPFVPTGTCASGASNVIARGPALDSSLTLYSDTGLGSYVTFDSSGRSLRTNSSNLGGTFVICYGPSLTSGSTAMARAVAVTSAGRIRQALDTNNDLMPNKDDGNNVASCTNP